MKQNGPHSISIYPPNQTQSNNPSMPYGLEAYITPCINIRRDLYKHTEGLATYRLLFFFSAPQKFLCAARPLL